MNGFDPAEGRHEGAWIEIERVTRRFAGRAVKGRTGDGGVAAVQDVSLRIGRGESIALVGTSGSGKSTLARIMAGLDRPTSGLVRYAGNVVDPESRKWQTRRHRMQMIFQDPAAALNPRHRAGDILAEVAEHGRGGRGVRSSVRDIDAMLTGVGLSPADREKFPHEFSGGQKQRLSLARALAAEPDTILADEPLSALDVSVQAQILVLLNALREERSLTLVFVTHDLAVVPHIAQRIAVMANGMIVEDGPVDEVFGKPRHEATKSLLKAARRGSTGGPKTGIV
ncbi:MAG: ABC transporter ATP-binding protein [Gemmatimonadetes bacterium]|nr:ABC transporter ATP-binding protein [Gemmatimonadota bacterium]